ncbi:MAG TPA: DinB family protein [Thermoanaerobaculia bacterium]|nr:DinB family protein [Thermoanaerobaculia bacterium]
MKNTLVFALMLLAGQAQQALAQKSTVSSSPVADATRSFLQREGKNLIAAAEEMPADKYDFHPTPEQMTFAHLMSHIAHSNRMLCSGIAGEAAPKETGVTDRDGKEKLVADVKASFDYCSSALAGVDDSRLAEEVPPFHRSRANAMMSLAADLADHYSMAASYLRLNGLLPPTAQRKK